MDALTVVANQYLATIAQLSARIAQAALLAVLSTATFAAEQQIDPAELQGQLQARSQLLTRANDELAATMGRLNSAGAEIERLKKAAAECKKEEAKKDDAKK